MGNLLSTFTSSQNPHPVPRRPNATDYSTPFCVRIALLIRIPKESPFPGVRSLLYWKLLRVFPCFPYVKLNYSPSFKNAISVKAAFEICFLVEIARKSQQCGQVLIFNDADQYHSYNSWKGGVLIGL